MEISIYRNGKQDSCLVYFGKVPRIVKESANWKNVYSGEILTESTLEETAERFRGFLETANIFPTYLDLNSNIKRAGFDFKIGADEMRRILE